MSDAGVWGFTDDRGTELTAVQPPERVVAYVRAGAALRDLGVTPVGVYGSGHDGGALDPVKAGELAAAGVPYLGPGRTLDEEAVRGLRPDLIVDVTYDGKSAYALDEAVAERLGVPLMVFSVGNELTLSAIIGRFGELGAALGGSTAPPRIRVPRPSFVPSPRVRMSPSSLSPVPGPIRSIWPGPMPGPSWPGSRSSASVCSIPVRGRARTGSPPTGSTRPG